MKRPDSGLVSAGSSPRKLSCFFCGAVNVVTKDELSPQCTGCGKSINMESVEIETPTGKAIETHGDVFIGVRGKFFGPMLKARKITVHGMLDGDFECGELLLGRVAQVNHTGKFTDLTITAASRITLSKPIETVNARVFGHLHAHHLTVTGEVIINRGGFITGKVSALRATVEKGGRFDGELIALPIPDKKEEPIIEQATEDTAVKPDSSNTAVEEKKD